ncbi:MAG: response regulator, partial [Proteobacteria bacterium]|nr:response regulator [Pseudomonadota bacterium]
MKNNTPKKVLVIDDERDIRDGCERILTRLDLEVLTAQNGQSGLDILSKEDICIVICDIKMPGMDGIEVLAQIQALYPSVIVIMITGFSTVENAIEAMKKGAYDFISKPFTPDQLRIVVKRALETLHLTEEAYLLKIERQRNLADLQTEQSRIRTIIETLPNGVLVTNISGEVVLMNQVSQQYLGKSQEHCLGKNIETCITDKGLCDYIREISACSPASGKEMHSYELILPEQRFILAQGRPVTGEDNECMGAVVTLSDITALKVFDRLKSEFVAKVSHELRSPLSIIHEQLAMVLKEKNGDQPDNNQYILGRAKEKTKTLISLIGDLLDISKIEAGKTKQEAIEVHVDDLIKKIIEFVHSQAQQKDQSILLNVTDKKIPPLIADPVALESIFGNLIT